MQVILNLNARSLSGEKWDELLVTVTDHNVCSLLSLKLGSDYIENCIVSILKALAWRERSGPMDEVVVLHVT